MDPQVYVLNMLVCPISYPMILNFDVTRIPIGIHMTGPRVFGMHTLDGSLQRANFSCLLWSIAKWCTLTWCRGSNEPKKRRGERKGRSEILNSFQSLFSSNFRSNFSAQTWWKNHPLVSLVSDVFLFCPDPWGEWSSFTHIFQPPTRFEQLHQPDQESLESSGSLSWSQLPLVGSVSLVCKRCVSTPKVGNKKSGRNRFIGKGTWS